MDGRKFIDNDGKPLDSRYREAEGLQLELPLPTPAQQQPRTEVEEGSCPYHQVFVYECHYCNPR